MLSLQVVFVTDRQTSGQIVKQFAPDLSMWRHKMKFVLRRVENIVGKGVNCHLPAFPAFPIMFSKKFFLRVVQSLDWVIKGLTPNFSLNDKISDMYTFILSVRENYGSCL